MQQWCQKQFALSLPSCMRVIYFANCHLCRGIFREFHGVPETLGTTIDHHPGINKCMKQQTVLCLAAQVHAG